jgi:hypothetical protein
MNKVLDSTVRARRLFSVNDNPIPDPTTDRPVAARSVIYDMSEEGGTIAHRVVHFQDGGMQVLETVTLAPGEAMPAWGRTAGKSKPFIETPLRNGGYTRVPAGAIEDFHQALDAVTDQDCAQCQPRGGFFGAVRRFFAR